MARPPEQIVRDFAPGEAACEVLPQSRRRLLLAVWAAATTLLAVRAFAHGVLAGRRPAGVGAVPVRIDINRATVAELQALPGVGPTRAEAIVLHRVRHGPFADVAALGSVDGLGADSVALLKDFACVLPQDEAR